MIATEKKQELWAEEMRYIRILQSRKFSITNIKEGFSVSGITKLEASYLA